MTPSSPPTTPSSPVTQQSMVTSVDPYLPGHGDDSFTVTRYELDLDYRVAGNRLTGRARLHARAGRTLSRFALDLTGLRVTKVLIGGRRPGRWTQRPGKLHIALADTVAVGAGFVVDVEYSGKPVPIAGTWGEVGWEELADGVIVAGQPDGAPSWFPCNDRPDHKASFRISVTTEPVYRVLANGALTERTNRAGGVRWVYDQPEPMATYLATVQIGRYDLLVTSEGPVRQLAAVPARLRSDFLTDFGRQGEMMALFEDRFGPYPFADYVVVVTDDQLEMPLEAQGMSVFGANHVDGRRGAQRLVAHELAHQWFGNSLTLERLQHIWLHEGFARYAEWLWSEHSGGRSAAALAHQAWDRLARLPQDLVIGDPGPERTFDDRVYTRGALTLHALRVTVGDDDFVATLRAWTGGHRHGTVTTAQFVDCAARHTPQPVDALLHTWLFDAALPPFPVAATRSTSAATPSGPATSSGPADRDRTATAPR